MTTTTIGDTVKELYKRGMRLRVNFTKLNGDERNMTIKRVPALEALCVGAPVYKREDRLPVCEIENPDANGPQWRCIPLDRVNYFICEKN